MRPEGLAAVLIGGPGQGRMERRDDARFGDLERLVICLAGRMTNYSDDLPQSLEGLTGCRRAPRFADPYTGEPYRYERRSDRDFAICAAFERPGRVQAMHGVTIDPETGCMTWTPWDDGK